MQFISDCKHAATHCNQVAPEEDTVLPLRPVAELGLTRRQDFARPDFVQSEQRLAAPSSCLLIDRCLLHSKLHFMVCTRSNAHNYLCAGCGCIIRLVVS